MAKKKYRQNVGIMVINKVGRVFMAHRADKRLKSWQMPQGGIDKGEKPLTAAVRELIEETGIKSISLIAQSTQWYTYDFPKGVTFLSEKKRSFAGQTQKWFLFLFEGLDAEIKLDQAHPEFDAWAWTPLSDVVDMIIEFKKEVYSQVVHEFTPFIEAVSEKNKA